MLQRMCFWFTRCAMLLLVLQAAVASEYTSVKEIEGGLEDDGTRGTVCVCVCVCV